MANDSIKLTRREGRNVFVFQRNGSDLFELEELPQQFPPRFGQESAADLDDPRDWTEGMTGMHSKPPPLPGAGRERASSWSRASISGLARQLND